MGETRTRRRIRLAIEAIGWDVLEMEWSHISTGPEKGGPDGGWMVRCRRRSDGVIDYAVGYNVDDLMRFLPLMDAPRYVPGGKP